MSIFFFLNSRRWVQIYIQDLVEHLIYKTNLHVYTKDLREKEKKAIETLPPIQSTDDETPSAGHHSTTGDKPLDGARVLNSGEDLQQGLLQKTSLRLERPLMRLQITTAKPPRRTPQGAA
jgi:short-subunit dehydrogenase involved in D-alanine esterification of teichoic acids